MIIFLHGPDGYRLSKGAQEIVGAYKKKYSSGLNFFVFDFADGLPEGFDSVIKSNSFFDEVKLVLVKNTFQNKNTADLLLKTMKDFGISNDKNVVLLFKEPDTLDGLNKKNKELLSFLKVASSLTRDFSFLEGKKLENWISKEFISRDCSISAKALACLLSSVGKNTERLSCEIEKLANYKLRGEISEKEIGLVVGRELDMNIFDLIDALGMKNKTKAIELLYKELETGRDPYYVLTMIVYQIRNMIIVNDLALRKMNQYAIAQKAGIHPYVVKKTLVGSSNYNLAELKSKFGYLATLDILFKNGDINLVDSLYNFVLA